MADVFISYKSERRNAAQHLQRILELNGYSVWFDYGLLTGRDFARQIEKELTDAKAVVVLWCSRSVGSNWVVDEAHYAKEHGKYVPVWIEQTALPFGFQRDDTIDLKAWDGSPRSPALDRLLDQIGHLVGRDAAPNSRGLRDHEANWRMFGAPSLADFALDEAAEQTEIRRAQASAPRAAAPAPIAEAIAPPAPMEAPVIAPPPVARTAQVSHTPEIETPFGNSRMLLLAGVAAVALLGVGLKAGGVFDPAPPKPPVDVAVKEPPKPTPAADAPKADAPRPNPAPVAKPDLPKSPEPTAPVQPETPKPVIASPAAAPPPVAPAAAPIPPMPSDLGPALADTWRLAHEGNIQAQYDLSNAYFGGTDAPQNDRLSVQWLRKPAEQGHIEAQSGLGWMYYVGRGVDKANHIEAAKWFKKAADKDNSMAQAFLARMLINGQGGLPKNPTEAAKLNRLAAEKGYPMAQYDLGMSLLEGLGIEQNEAEAINWIKQAAEQDYFDAYVQLGFMTETGKAGLIKDQKEAVRLYRLAAEQGNARGQFNLGNSLLRGIGVQKDEAAAAKWIRKAADQNLVQAQATLGFMIQSGIGGLKKDNREAVRFYRLAADQGDALGQYNLATCLMDGIGVEKNELESLLWMRKSAAQNHASAQISLGWMYENAKGGLTKDSKEAVRWYKLAAEQGNAIGQFNLGLMYEMGTGVARPDRAEAVRLYRLAAAQNNADAIAALKRLGVKP